MTNVRARHEAGFLFGPEIDVRKLSRVEVSARDARKLQDAVRDLVAAYPFLGSLSSSDSIAYHAVTNVPFQWAATDAVGVFLNAAKGGFFDDDTTTHENRMFLIGHEILHQVLESVSWKHIHRTQGWVPVPRDPVRAPDGMLPFDNDTWEQAEDARINPALLADKVGIPPVVETPNGRLTIHTHPGITFAMDFGEAYAMQYATNFPPNPNQPKPQPQGGQGQPGGQQGQQPPPQGGQGQQPPQPGQQPPQPGQQPGQGQGQPNPLNDVLEPGQGGDAHSNDPGADTPMDAEGAAADLAQGKGDREVRVSRAKNAARQAGAGSCAVEELVVASREPGVDWRSYVPGFLARCSGNSAFDYSRPARPPITRELLGLDSFFSPNRAGHGCDVVVFVGDTSGSIQEAEHRAMLGAISEMLSTLRPKEFIVLWCDTRIQRVDRDVDLDTDFSRYVIPKGGGTSFIPPFAWVANSDLRPDGLIYFTDMYGEAPSDAPPYPVLWLSTTDLLNPQVGGRWGETVKIPIHDLHRD